MTAHGVMNMHFLFTIRANMDPEATLDRYVAQ